MTNFGDRPLAEPMRAYSQVDLKNQILTKKEHF